MNAIKLSSYDTRSNEFICYEQQSAMLGMAKN
jgi:hypothetical protein